MTNEAVQSTLTDLANDLHIISEKIAMTEIDILGPLKERQKQLRELITDTMDEYGVQSVATPYETIVFVRRREYVVHDRDELESAIREAGLCDQVSRPASLDLTKAKKLGAQHEMPGVTQEWTTNIQVRPR